MSSRKDDNGQPMIDKDDNGQPMIDVDYERKCGCSSPKPRMVNYSMMWHEADIVCGECGGFIRYWDAG